MMKYFRNILLAAALIAHSMAFAADTTNSVASNDLSEDFQGYSVSNSVIGSNGWYADTNAVTADIVVTNMTYSGSLPISGTGPLMGTQVLSLEAGSSVLTNKFDITEDNPIVYVDMLVQMNPADDIPAVITNNPSAQTAIWLNSTSNLVVHCDDYDLGYASYNTNSVLTQKAVTNGEWIRITFVMDYAVATGMDDGYGWFKLKVNGTDMTNSHAYTDPAAPNPADRGANPVWFVIQNVAGSSDYLTALELSGAGLFDNISVSTNDPYFIPAATYTVTVSAVTGGMISPATPLTVASNGSSVLYTFALSNGYYLQSYMRGSETIAATGTTHQMLNVTSNITLGAVFALDTGSLSNGVPEGWIQQNVGAYSDYTNVVSADPDGDGYTTAEEFLTSTDPDDADSVFRISSVSTNGGHELRWTSIYDSSYALPPFLVQTTTDITNSSSWTDLGIISRTDGTFENTYQTAAGSGAYYYYRVVATN